MPNLIKTVKKGWFAGGFLVPSVRRGQEWRTQLLRVHAGLFLTTFENVSSNRSLLTANLEFHKCALLDQANNVTNLDKYKYALHANNVTKTNMTSRQIMWPTWTLLRTSLTGFSLPLTRMVEGQLTLRKSGAVLTSFFDFRVGFHFSFFRESEYLVYCWFHNFFLVFQVSLLEKEDLWNWI